MPWRAAVRRWARRSAIWLRNRADQVQARLSASGDADAARTPGAAPEPAARAGRSSHYPAAFDEPR